MTTCAAIDANGNDIRVGDWVRVLLVPRSVFGMPIESKRAFAAAIGNTFQVANFDETGCLELDLWPKVSVDTIWIEPNCVARTRRPTRFGKAFERKLQLKATPSPPRLEVKFDIVAMPGVDLEALGFSISTYGSSGGFAVWPKERRIKGSVYADKNLIDARALLEHAISFVRTCNTIESFTASEIADAEI